MTKAAPLRGALWYKDRWAAPNSKLFEILNDKALSQADKDKKAKKSMKEAEKHDG
jgi:hypothetical protein